LTAVFAEVFKYLREVFVTTLAAFYGLLKAALKLCLCVCDS